ncbi:MAG: hypothetical protein LBL48_05250 [Azoarcus sp.]|jgi:hypothetical protein|nr:hypothetical protein [Azoarcus sp.]
MRYRYLFMIGIVLLLGCSSIPFDAANGNAKIESDLQMPAGAISLSSRCRFFPLEYGPQWPVTMQECVFIKTWNAFEFLGYDKRRQVYVSKHRIAFSDVQCATHITEGLSRGLLNLNTNEHAIILALLQPNGNRLDLQAVEDVVTTLSNNDVRILDEKSPPVGGYYVQRTVVRNPCRF